MPLLPTNLNATPRQGLADDNHSVAGKVEAKHLDRFTKITDQADQQHNFDPKLDSPPSKRTPHLKLQTSDIQPDKFEDICKPSPVLSTTKSDLSKKKKGSSVLGFLALKEPSTSAWEEYAKAQKEQAAQKVGRPVAVGMPGVSSQRLPSHVPRVNSKWDGLPQSAKTKNVEQKERNEFRRSSAMSFDRQRSGTSLRSGGTNSESSSTLRFVPLPSHPPWSKPVTPVFQDQQRTVSIPTSDPKPQIPTRKSSFKLGRTLRFSASTRSSRNDGLRSTFLLPPSPTLAPSNPPNVQGAKMPLNHIVTCSKTYSPSPPPQTSRREKVRLEQNMQAIPEPQRPNGDFGTFWISDSDDGTMASPNDSRVPRVHGSAGRDRPATVYNDLRTFYLDEADTPKMPKYQYQIRTLSASSGVSNSTMESEASAQSASQLSVFSTNQSIVSRPSTDASSVETYHAEGTSSSEYEPSLTSTVATAKKIASSRARQVLTGKVNRAKVSPLESSEPPARQELRRGRVVYA